MVANNPTFCHKAKLKILLKNNNNKITVTAGSYGLVRKSQKVADWVTLTGHLANQQH